MEQRDSVFGQVWSLYQACRRNGTWAKLVLESGEDGETFSFTSKRPPVPVHVAAAVNPPRPQSTRSNKRKSPSNLKKDRIKWRAWLERKLMETEQSCGEETGPQFERPPPIFAPSYASVASVSKCSGEDESTQLPTHTEPTTYTSPPPSTPSSEEDLYRCEEDSSVIFTTPGGTQLAVLQPVPAGVDEERGISVRSDAPHLDSKLTEPAAHSSQPGGPCSQPGRPQGRGPTTPVSTVTSNIQGTPVKKGYCFQGMPRSEFLKLSQNKKKKLPNQEKPDLYHSKFNSK